MREMFSEEERLVSNVGGKNDTLKFSPKEIRVAAFEMLLLRQKETEKGTWSECIKAIDACNCVFRTKSSR